MNNSIASLPPSQPMATVLARSVLAQAKDAPEALSQMLILLPSRRAVRHLREAFLRESHGKALLLPQMQAIGDLEEAFLFRHAALSEQGFRQLQSLPPAIGKMERLFALAEMIRCKPLPLGEVAELARAGEGVLPSPGSLHSPTSPKGRGEKAIISFEHAIEMAHQLADLLDEFQREQCSLDALDALVPEEYAAQWQHTLAFLRILREQWPKALAACGRCDPWQRRNALLAILAGCWQQQPPQTPIIAAGTTGTVPAVAALLKVIAGLPQGKVLLPGVDGSLSDDEWNAIDETHSQHSLKMLLRDSGFRIRDSATTARESWLSLALLPAAATERWQSASLDTTAAVENCQLIPCTDTRNEALTLALLLRETLETPGKTAALITPNTALARQVRAQLGRWNIAVNDSSGTPLAQTAVGNFVILLLRCIDEQNAPVALLALLKHPLTRLGLPAAEIRRQVRMLEHKALRGIAPSGLFALQQRFAGNPALSNLLHALEKVLEPLSACAIEPLHRFTLTDLLGRLITVMTTLSTDENGHPLCRQGEGAQELAELLEEMTACPPLSLPFSSLPPFMESLLRREVARPLWNQHPRLQILTPMEARMLAVDRVILGGLNEGEWPALPTPQPWLSRAMRKAVGLPAPEREIGLSAHDFCQLAALPEVFMTRAAKPGGTVSVPSRFLQRMQAVLERCGGKEAVIRWHAPQWEQWAQALDSQAENSPALAAPRPTPPREMRPRKLGVTSIERLQRDPYGIYAEKILRLKPLEPLQHLPKGREFGDALHKALENWSAAQGLAALLQEARKQCAPYGDSLVVEALWLPRIERIGEWLLEQHWPQDSRCEIAGEWVLNLPGGAFRLTGRIDRLDLTEEGLRVIDYKTGATPSKRDQHSGLSSQLPLLAAMVEQGAFGADLASHPISALQYWTLKGGSKGGEIKKVAPPKDMTLENWLADIPTQLTQLLERFDDPATPYLSVPDWRNRPTYNDYEHLARIREWAG